MPLNYSGMSIARRKEVKKKMVDTPIVFHHVFARPRDATAAMTSQLF